MLENTNALLLTSGLHGMLSQTKGIANALGLNYKQHVIKLKKSFSWLPSQLLPAQPFIFQQTLPTSLPKFIVSCGRHSAIASKFLKSQHGDNIFTIHIQNPIIHTSAFDCVLIPEHDNITGKSVIVTKGAIHDLDWRSIIDHNKQSSWPKNQKDQVAVILGGPTKSYAWSSESLKQAVTSLQKATDHSRYQLVFVPSNRTPKTVLNMLQSVLLKPHVVLPNVDKAIYLSALNYAKHIVVTCDSASMLSEACFTGKPVYCLEFKTRSQKPRLAKLHQSLYAEGMVKPWRGTFDQWSYTPLDEARRVAQILKEKHTHVFV